MQHQIWTEFSQVACLSQSTGSRDKPSETLDGLPYSNFFAEFPFLPARHLWGSNVL